MYGLFVATHFDASLAILKKFFLAQLPKNLCNDLPLLLATLGVEANRGVVSSFNSEPVAILILSSQKSSLSSGLLPVFIFRKQSNETPLQAVQSTFSASKSCQEVI
uniref:Uncharacterized protein n=1 Tax=Glossina austeni TaxID=7395 RepID=A0A1A9UWX9_GLOAU